LTQPAGAPGAGSAVALRAAGARPRPPSFWEGVTALPRGLRFIAQNPRCWPAAATPVLVLLLLAVPVLWWTIGELGPWLSRALFGETHSWYEESARVLVRWLASALTALLGLWLALLLSPALSSPALERLVRAREASLGVAPRAAQGFWFELVCGLRAQLGGLLLALPLWVAYWLAAWLIPGAALLLFPLQALPLALGLAWNLLDYPLTLRGVRVRERWGLLRQHPASILGLGASMALASLIPGAALLLLPAGVVGAAQLSLQLLPDSVGTS
jgi:CysZ protein